MNGQRIGSHGNSSVKASRKRIASLVKQQIILDHALLQRSGVNEAVKHQVKRTEPIFTYHSPYPKVNPEPAPITQDEEDPEQVSKPSTKLRCSPRIKGFVSPHTAGIEVGALHQFMGNAFLEEMKLRVKINDTLLGPEEVGNGVVHPVNKETITKYKKIN